MSSLLDRLFANRGALIIGYSAWDGDVIMEALRRRMLGQTLPYNVYFFCYRRANRDSLPDWFKDHQNVRFVVPQEEKPKTSEPTVVRAMTDVRLDRAVPATRLAAEPFTVDRGGEPTLQARDILDALIQRLSLDPPELVTDPLGFFEQQLRNASLPQSEQDPYSFLSVADKIHAAKAPQLDHGPQEQAIAAELESVRNAIRRSQYIQAVEIASAIELSVLKPEEKGDLFRTLMLVWIATKAPEENLRVIEQLEKVHAALVEPARSQLGKDFARVLGDKGVTLSQLNRSEDALVVYDDLLRRCDATEPALHEQTARALFNKGFTLGQLNRSEEELEAYDDLLRRFSDATEPALREQVARALVNKGVRLGKLNRSEEALAVYDDLLRRFGDATEPALRELVARTLLYKGITLRQLGQPEQATTCLNDLVRQFEGSTDLGISEAVRQAKKLLEEQRGPESAK